MLPPDEPRPPDQPRPPERDRTGSVPGHETAASRRAHGPERDPQSIVTEYAFRVDPGLLGAPLAGPFRRLAGMLLDLVVLGLLFPIRAIGGALLGGVLDFLVAGGVAWLLWRLASSRSEEGGPWAAVRRPGPVLRFGLRSAAIVVALTGLGSLLGGGDDESEPEDRRAEMAAGRVEEPRRAVERAVGDDRRGELSLAPGVADSLATRTTARADSILRMEAETVDSLTIRYARALEEGRPEETDSLRKGLRQALAGKRLAALGRENRRLEDRLEEATRTPSFLRRARTLLTEDLGIGVGWMGLYFTLFLVLWGGRTPGKRMVGTRVVRLSGEPLGWWDAFSRFGGYAAGLATGMLGFLQIFWDPNRQALHDRIVGTVVIRMRGSGARPVAGGKPRGPAR